MKWIYRLQRLFATLFSTLIDRIVMCIKGIHCGKSYHSCGRVLMVNKGGDGAITIGNYVNINSLGTRNPGRIEGMTMLLTSSTGKIRIGENVGMSNCILYSESGITIGNDVTIGAGTKIFDTDCLIPSYKNINNYIPSIPIKIGNRVFVGGNVIILKGVTIGDESVVGSGSVVTHNIGENEVWAGNPARLIKKINKNDVKK